MTDIDRMYFVLKVKGKKGMYDFSDLPISEKITRDNKLRCFNDFSAWKQALRMLGEKHLENPKAQVYIIHPETNDVYSSNCFT